MWEGNITGGNKRTSPFRKESPLLFADDADLLLSTSDMHSKLDWDENSHTPNSEVLSPKMLRSGERRDRIPDGGV